MIRSVLAPFIPEVPKAKQSCGIIYSITNRENGKRYIGKTMRTFNVRYGVPWWHRVTNRVLKADIEQFGPAAFDVEILLQGITCHQELADAEAMAIYACNSLYPTGYNLIYDTNPMSSSLGIVYAVNLDRGTVHVQPKQTGRPFGSYLRCGGRPLSIETKTKISVANKGRRRTPEQCLRIGASVAGRKQSVQEVEKRRRALIGKHTRPILQIDPRDGRTIQRFNSIQEAATSCGLRGESNLTSVCKGRQKTAGGFVWRYAE